MIGWAGDLRLVTALANHLWQSTLCLGAAALLAWLLRRGDARWRHAIWAAASIKFLVPVSALVAIGALLPHPSVSEAPPPIFSTVVQLVGEPFTPPVEASMLHSSIDLTVVGHASTRPSIPAATAGLILWGAGVAALLAMRVTRWRELSRLVRTAERWAGDREHRALEAACARLSVRTPLTLISADRAVQPGVVGVLSPAILWPVEISKHLLDAELEAIIAHEVVHVRRRDNLIAAVHRLVELLFWFYPVVWWIETRLLRERERACDEAVVTAGHDRRSYAHGILKVSRFCLESAPHLAAGITGSSLARRVEDIMSGYSSSSIGIARRALLVTTAILLIGGPIGVGYLQAAPNLPSLPEFSVPLTAVLAPVPPLPVEPPAPQAMQSGISGIVTDQRGGAVKNATVSATPFGGGTPASTTTDDNGRFALNLAPAQYELQVSKPGFKRAQAPIFVTRDSPLRRDVQLQLGAVQETLNVIPPPNDTRSFVELVDAARAAYEQSNFAQAEATTRLALMRLSAESAARAQQARARQTAAGVSTPVRIGGEISEPKKIHDVKPIYPPTALEAKISGVVIMEATIGEDGSVINASILQGEPLLNQAALDAVLQWKFVPTLLNGAPVPVLMTVTVNFALR